MPIGSTTLLAYFKENLYVKAHLSDLASTTPLQLITCMVDNDLSSMLYCVLRSMATYFLKEL